MKIKLLTLTFALCGVFGTQAQNVLVTNDANHPVPITGTLSGGSGGPATVADGADVAQGAKADAKSTATDTTPISAISILKEISAMSQAPPSRAVTNAGTFAVQAATTIADGSDATLGAKADAKSTATDTTPISAISILKEISSMEQAPASRAVTNAGTFAVQANVSAINGVTPLMGAGNTGTGSQRVTIASDQAVIPIKELVTTIATGQVTAGAAATLVGSNAARYKLTVRNEDASLSVYVGPATVTTANGALIKAGESRVFRGATLLQVVAASGSPVVDYVDESY